MACKSCSGGGKSKPAKTQAQAMVGHTFVTNEGKIKFEQQPDGTVLAKKVG